MNPLSQAGTGSAMDRPAAAAESGERSHSRSTQDLQPHRQAPRQQRIYPHANPSLGLQPNVDPHYARMGTGRPYSYFTPFILSEADKTEPLLRAFNESDPGSDRDTKLKALMQEAGEGCMVIPPLFVEWGSHTRLGKGVYIGTGVNLQDTGGVVIGDNAMIGPSCTLATVSHPLDPALRGAHPPEISRPVVIGPNAWLGANVTVLGGVEVGEGSVIGAGSVLTKSTGKAELWVGVPARKVRDLDGADDGVDWGDVPPVPAHAA